MRRRPVLPPVYFLLALVLMVSLHLVVPVRQIIPSRLRYIGVGPLVAGLLLNVWAARLFDRAGTTIKPFQSSSVLVVHGPYRLSRNPMYLGLVVALVGVAVLAGSLTPWAVIPLFALVIDRRFIRAEEAELTRVFGAAYSEFSCKVRRWL
jgi:protein-S-isoprenylcysteine O-methyltransferase Ste14